LAENPIASWNDRAAPGRRNEIQQQLDGCGFSGAAGAKQGKYIACRHAEVGFTDGAESTEGLRETMRYKGPKSSIALTPSECDRVMVTANDPVEELPETKGRPH
jgi:hypothetical protein